MIFSITGLIVNAQPWMRPPYLATKIGNDPTYDEIDHAFHKYWGNKPMDKSTKGWKQFIRWKDYWKYRRLPDGSFPSEQFYAVEWERYEKYRKEHPFESPMLNNVWQFIGPIQDPKDLRGNMGMGTGRVNILRMDPNNPSILWAGSADGGLWQTIDAGKNWTTTTLSLPSLGGAVNDIAISKANSNTIYVLTGDNTRLGIDFSGIFHKSTDGGKTWQELHFPAQQFPGLRRIIVHPNDENKLVAACDGGYWEPGYLVYSDDGGLSWRDISPEKADFFDLEIKPDDPDFIYVSTSDSRVFSITNFGLGQSSVRTLNHTFGTAPRAINIEVTPARPDWIYALVADKDWGYYGMFLSTDKGDTWKMQSHSPNILQYNMSDTGGLGWYCLMFGVSVHNPNELYVGGPFLTKSTDGGLTWERPDQGGMHPDLTAMVFHPTDSDLIYCSNDGSVQLSIDQGSTWRYASYGMVITRSYDIGQSPNEDAYFCVGQQDNGVFRYFNRRWNSIFGGDGMTSIVHPTQSATLYTSWQQGHIVVSPDRGNSFYEFAYPEWVGESGPWVTKFALHPYQNKWLYMLWRQVWLHKGTRDSIVKISDFPGNDGMCEQIVVSKKNPDIIYVYRAYPEGRNKLFKTTNGGTSWEEITRNLPINYGITAMTGLPDDPNTLWVTIGSLAWGQKAYQTTDGGITWNNVSGTLPNLAIRSILFHNTKEGILYLAADYGKVFYRTLGMTDWSPIAKGLTFTNIQDLDVFNNPSGISKLRACTWGRGVWELEIEPAVTPICEKPKNIRLIRSNALSAVVSWDAVPQAKSYIVASRPKNTGWSYQSVETNEATITFAETNTEYEVMVQTVCDNLVGSTASDTIQVRPGNILDKGLIVHYQFCGNSLVDVSSNQIHAKVIGRTIPVQAIRGEGQQLPNGVNDHCNDVNPIFFQMPALGAIWENGFTLGVLLRFDVADGSRRWERIIDFNNGPGKNNILFSREGNSNNLICQIWNGNQEILGQARITDAIEPDVWTFFTLTLSQDEIRIYKDGGLVAKENYPGISLINVPRSYNYIAHSADGWCDHNLLGAFDDLKIYNYPLSEVEIQKWYTSLQPYQNQCKITADKTILTQRSSYVQLQAECNNNAVSYNWFPATGINQTDIVNPQARPLNRQTYYCNALFPDGCTVTDSVTIDVDYTSRSELQLTTFRLHPGRSSLELALNTSEEATVEITDVTGRILHHRRLPASLEHIESLIDLNGWAKGIYIIHIKTDISYLSRKFVWTE